VCPTIKHASGSMQQVQMASSGETALLLIGIGIDLVMS
jgi:hypothetical protein